MRRGEPGRLDRLAARVARPQVTKLHQAIHLADDALRIAPVPVIASIQAALVLLDDARRQALPTFPVLARLLQQAEYAVVGQGRAAPLSPEERRDLAAAILESVLRDIHVEDPHSSAGRLN